MISRTRQLKIIDFGDANFFSAKHLLRKNRQLSSFLAPEIHKGESYDGRQADLWSFGAVLYTLVVGKLENVTEIIRPPKVSYRKS
jgi:serine/threonine protein kinase